MSFDPTRPPAALPPYLDVNRAIAWVWSPTARRFVWASPAALGYWRAENATALAARAYAPAEPTAREMERLWKIVMSTVEADSMRADGRREALAEFAPAGRSTPAICAVSPQRLIDGRPGLLVEIVEDGARAQAEAQTRRWRALFTATPAPLAVFDADGLLIERNEAAVALFAEPTPTGARIEDCFADPIEARRALRVALADGAYSQTVSLRLRDGLQPRRLRLARVDAPVDGAPAVLALTLDKDDARLKDVASLGAVDAAAFGLAHLERRTDGLTALTVNPELERLIGPLPVSRPISDSAPALAKALTALAARLDDDPSLGALSIDLTVGVEAVAAPRPMTDSDDAVETPGPWRRATLRWLADRRYALSVADLGPERRALLRLKTANDENAAALEGLGVGLAAIDPEGRLQAVTPEAARLIGATSDSLIGQPLDALLPRSDACRLLDYLDRGPVVAGRDFEKGVETRINAPAADKETGGDRPVRLAIAPRSRLNPSRRRVAFYEITDPRAKTADNSASPSEPNPRAVELAHALRTRLTSVQGFAELLLEETPIDFSPLADAYLADIVTAAQECVALINRNLAPQPGLDAPVEAPAAHAGAALTPLLRSVAARRDDMLGRQGPARTVLTLSADDIRIATRPAQLREALERLMVAIEADAEGGPATILVDRPHPGAVLVTANAPGGPAPADDLSMRLLESALEPLGASVETAKQTRRISILLPVSAHEI